MRLSVLFVVLLTVINCRVCGIVEYEWICSSSVPSQFSQVLPLHNPLQHFPTWEDTAVFFFEYMISRGFFFSLIMPSTSADWAMLYKCSSDPCTRRFPRRHGTYLVGQEWEGALGTFVYLEKTCLSRYIVIETPAAFYLPDPMSFVYR